MSIKLTLISIAVVLALGVGWYVKEQSSLRNMPEEKMTGTGTIIDLLKRGKAISCTYTQDSLKAGKGSGTLYLDGVKHVRVDGHTTKGTEEFDSHIIYNSVNMYMWVQSPQKSFAVVVPVKNPVITTGKSNATLDTQTMYDDVTYECTSWKIDESVFVPPRNIVFTDMAGLIQEVFKGFPTKK